MYSYCYFCVFLLLCMFCSEYSLSLCCSVHHVCKCVLYYCHRVSTQLQLTNISNIPWPPTPKYFWTFIEIITWVSTLLAVPSSSLHHHLGPNSFNPEDGSSTIIPKTTIKLQHMVSKFGTLQSEQSPQTVRIQVFWHMMLCCWVSGSWHIYSTVFLQWQEAHTQQCSVITNQTWMLSNNV